MAAWRTGRIVLRREVPAHALQQALLVEQEHRLDLGLGQGSDRVGREPHVRAWARVVVGSCGGRRPQLLIYYFSVWFLPSPHIVCISFVCLFVVCLLSFISLVAC